VVEVSLISFMWRTVERSFSLVNHIFASEEISTLMWMRCEEQTLTRPEPVHGVSSVLRIRPIASPMPSLFKRSLLPKLRSFPLTADAVTFSGAAEFRRCLLEKSPGDPAHLHRCAVPAAGRGRSGNSRCLARRQAQASGTGRRGGRLAARPARLIGAGKQPGNSAWYQEMTRTHE
jgi:CDP-diacylglycerol--serine O-phosphatidyltransferase